MSIYRYRFLGPNQAALQRRVPGSPAVTTIGPYKYLDYTTDAANKADLDAAMAARGWGYLSTDPTPTPRSQAADSLLFSGVAEKTAPVDADVILIADSAASWAKKKVQIGNLPGIQFGRLYQYAERLDDVSFGGSVAYQNYLTLTMPASTPAGDYYVHWCAQVAMSSVSYAYQFRVRRDDLTLLQEILTFTTTAVSTETNTVSGFGVITLTSGAHHFDIDYTPSNSAATMYVLEAKIELWRVG